MRKLTTDDVGFIARWDFEENKFLKGSNNLQKNKRALREHYPGIIKSMQCIEEDHIFLVNNSEVVIVGDTFLCLRGFVDIREPA